MKAKIVTSYGVELENAKPEDFKIVEPAKEDGIQAGSMIKSAEGAIAYSEKGYPTAYVFDGSRDQCKKMLSKIQTYLVNADNKSVPFDIGGYWDEFPDSTLLAKRAPAIGKGVNAEMGSERKEELAHECWEKRCKYHPPKNDEQREAHEMVNLQIEQAGKTLIDICPDTIERDKALDGLIEVKMWANACLAVNINAE